MGSSSMKVHPFAGAGLWDHHHHQHHEPPAALSLGCKRLRPLAPKLNHHDDAAAATTTPPFDLKSFIKPDSRPRKSDHDNKHSSHHVETQSAGGTRWNPTQEQIGILEMLYRSGMRTPNAQQIEQITEQLSKYGKIEGKNVFYWFQNHKARERQKMKRSILGLCHRPRTPPPAPPLNTSISLTFLDTPLPVEGEREEVSPYKRNCRSWGVEVETSSSSSEENNMTIHNYRDHEEHKTLELFPLHPEGR